MGASQAFQIAFFIIVIGRVLDTRCSHVVAGVMWLHVASIKAPGNGNLSHNLERQETNQFARACRDGIESSCQRMEQRC
jgi:hypothetical protein